MTDKNNKDDLDIDLDFDAIYGRQQGGNNNYYSDVYSNSGKNYTRSPEPKKPQKRKKKTGKKVIAVIACILAVILLGVVAVNLYVDNMLEKNLKRNTSYNESNVSVNEDVFGEDIVNIALFGIDTRENTFKGRSDAIVILTLDKKNDKIKMTSIARDTYVDIENVKKDKVAHAYAYGGAELAVKTLNQTFGLDIKDYVTVNFFGFAQIIDYLGPVYIDVDEKEMKVMNDNYISFINSYGIKCDYITKTGPQYLSGGQALAYTRNRYTGGDTARGTRQREVLSACFANLKKLGVGKIPDLIKMGLQNCETSLDKDEIKAMGIWALTNSPEIENLSIPDAQCNPKEGDDAYINGKWFYLYDIDIASKKIHAFINGESTDISE